MKIVVIDKASYTSQFLGQRLARFGFNVAHAVSVNSAIRKSVCNLAVSVIINLGTCALDDGIKDISYLRSAGISQPIIVFIDPILWTELVQYLEAGADVVLTMPLHSDVIAAHLRSLLRRSSGLGSGRLSLGELEVDFASRAAWLGDDQLELTRLEFRLLQLFALNPERIISGREIQDYLRPNPSPRGVANATIVLISRLRQKIGREKIRTIRGFGYRLEQDRGI